MKILFICGAGILSGKEKVTLTLMDALRENGCDVYCLTSIWGNGQFSALLKQNKYKFKKTRLGFITWKLSWINLKMNLHQLLSLPRLWIDYLSFTKECEPSVIIHSNFHHVILLFPILGLKQKHYYHAHEVTKNTRFYKLVFQIFKIKISKFIGVSNYVKDSLYKLGLENDIISCIYNGIKINKNIDCRIDRLFTIGIVGQIGKWKGHEDLFEIINILKAKHVRFRCIIYGRGNETYIKYLKDKAQSLGISSFLIWEGFKLNIAEIYNSIDVLCAPSLCEEAFGMTIIEAATFAVPSVVYKRGGMSELVKNGETGYIIDVGDINTMAEKLIILASNRLLRETLGLNAKTHIESNFTDNIVADRFLQLFGED